MKAKLIAISLGAAAVACTSYLIWPEWFGLCESRMTTRGPVCSSPYGYPYGVTLLPFSVGLLLASLLTLLATRTTFRRWAWFTLWFGIGATILMLLAAASEIDIGFLTVSLFDLEKVAQALAVLYVALAVLLLGISDYLVRRKR